MDRIRIRRIGYWVSVLAALVAVFAFSWSVAALASSVSSERFVAALFSEAVWWGLPAVILPKLPSWMAWIASRFGGLKFRVREYPGEGTLERIVIDADLRQPIDRDSSVAWTRLICSCRSIFLALLITLLLVVWLTLSQSPLLVVMGSVFLGMLAWEVYPRGENPWAYCLDGDLTAQALGLSALGAGLRGETALQDWHAMYFDLARTPVVGSAGEGLAASWIHFDALLKGDRETAARYIERHLELLPTDAPLSECLSVGKAAYFYTVAAPDEARSDALIRRIPRTSSGIYPRLGRRTLKQQSHAPKAGMPWLS